MGVKKSLVYKKLQYFNVYGVPYNPHARKSGHPRKLSTLNIKFIVALCYGHYNRAPDLGKCIKWWNTWDSAELSILDAKVLDRDVTWLSKHKDTS